MNARDVALLMLDRLNLPEWPADSLAASRVRPSSISQRDQELAVRITQEVTRNLLYLNRLLLHFADRKMNKIDPLVRKIIGIGLAQILFLDRIPPSAAVDEAVEQTKRFGKRSASGFVNAVLRRAARGPLPQSADPQVDPAGYAIDELSHPRELVDRLLDVVGKENLLAICRHNQRRPPTILRLTPGVTLERQRSDGITLTPHERPGMAIIQPTVTERLVEWSAQGVAQAQDPTSASVVDLLKVEPGMNLLDRCCGMGTKTMQLREQLGDTGTLVAVDRNEMRVENLRSIVAGRNIKNVQAVLGSDVGDAEPWVPAKGFDRVLADVPCSNSGVLPRRSMAKYFQDEKTLASLEKLQLEILNDTAPAVAMGGLLLYSTCSIWREENELLIQQFVQSHPEFVILNQHTTLPSFDTDDPAKYHDGGFAALLLRR